MEEEKKRIRKRCESALERKGRYPFGAASSVESLAASHVNRVLWSVIEVNARCPRASAGSNGLVSFLTDLSFFSSLSPAGEEPFRKAPQGGGISFLYNKKLPGFRRNA